MEKLKYAYCNECEDLVEYVIYDEIITEQYKGEDVVLRAGSIISIADGLAEVVFPTCKMKIVKNLIVIKD